MFKIFKRNKLFSLETDISKDPSILFNNKIPSDELSFFHVRLGDTIELIDIKNIKTTSMETLPKTKDWSSYREDKIFYIVEGKEIEFELTDRIITVFENDGWLHMHTGAKYRVRNRVIVEFAIHDALLKPYKKIQKSDIELKFGKADKIKETWENYDGTLFNTDYIYHNRKLRIHYQDWDKEINGINIGETLIDCTHD